MPKKPRPLERNTGRVRDASLIVVASEDTYAVKQYFARFKTRRVQFTVIPTKDCRSAPNHVIERINAFKNEFATEEGDSFWLCIDRDRWPEDSLGDVLRECLAKGYGIALSRPCFELWILLHHEDLTNEHAHDANGVENRLREVLGGYTKQCCQTLKIDRRMVEEAMRRARAMDNGEMLPAVAQTRVFKILEAMLEKEAIELV